MREFLDTLQLGDSVLVGSSLGGLAARRVALHTPDRVSALCLIGSAGLGREVSPALRQMTLPGVGEAAIWWGRTAIGAAQRLLVRMPLLFANPTRAPQSWFAEQYRLARLPGFLETTLAALRVQVAPKGQRQILVNALPRLSMPTLLVWAIVTSSSPSARPARQRACCHAVVWRSSATAVTCRTWSGPRSSWRRCRASSRDCEAERPWPRAHNCEWEQATLR